MSIVHGFYPRDGGVLVAAQNDHGSGGGAAPMVRMVKGWSSHNNGFNFRRNPPGVGVGGSGWGAVYFIVG